MTTIKTRGRTFTGVVTSDKMSKTVTVRWERKHAIPKYERYEKRKSVVKAHVPEGMEVVVGDVVTIKETRPLSKTKHFIVTKVHNGNTEASKAEPSKSEPSAQKPVVSKNPVKKTVKKTETKVSESSSKPKKTTKKAVKKTVKKAASKSE